MGYESERATDATIRRLVASESVQRRIAEMEPRSTAAISPPPAASVQASDWLPDYVVGVDGSWHTLPVEQGYPGTEISFHSVVSVLLKIRKLAELDANRPVNPLKFKETRKSDAFDVVLSGTNFTRKGESDPRAAFRFFLYESLGERGLITDEETLLQTYEHLLAQRKNSGTMKCPYKEACGDPALPFHAGNGVYKCSCSKQLDLYSTDALDIHSSLRESGSSGRMFGEAQEVIEHLWLLNVVRAFVRRRSAATLDTMAFVMDGPLRIDGEPAWLSWCIRDELMRLNAQNKVNGGKDLLIIGIEKTGNFVEHFKQLDMRSTGTPDKLQPGTLYLLDDKYIRENIAPSAGTQQYGYQTYYGRKFFYKTQGKALICAHVAFLNPGDNDLSRADASQFARLPDVLSILDKLGSARYPDALIPIIAAHAETAIPLVQGRKVLEMLARDALASTSV